MNYFQIEPSLFFLALAANLAIGLIVFRYSEKSQSRSIFLLFILSQILWISSNYLGFIVSDKNLFLWDVRITTFFSISHVFFLFLFVYTFLSGKNVLSKHKLILMTSITSVIALLSLTPFIWSGVIENDLGQLSPVQGPAIPVFGIFTLICVISTFYFLVKRYRASEDIEKIQWKFLATGLSITFLLIFIFSLGSFVFFDNVTAVRLGYLYTLPFVILTVYAIIKHHLLNIKIVTIEMLTVATWAILIVQVINAETVIQTLLRGLLVAIFTFLSFLLIRGIVKEEKLAEQQYEMVATVSHQLRTPLTPVLGYSAMMAQGDFDGHPEELKDAEQRLFIATKRLRNIINDFLQIFELEGERQLDSESSSIAKLVQEAVDGVTDNYEQKDLYLKYENTNKVDANIVGESKLLVQAINNLLDNAQRYTLEGGTTVNLEVKKGRAIIKVTDTGIGLDDKDKVRLFSKFYRSDAAKEVRPDGSGLGLSIVKNVIEAHGGHITAESEGRGKGTTFIIELPVKK